MRNFTTIFTCMELPATEAGPPMTSKTVTASGVPTARQIAAVFIAAFTTPIVGLTTITKKNRVAIVGVNWNDLSVKGEVNRERWQLLRW